MYAYNDGHWGSSLSMKNYPSTIPVLVSINMTLWPHIIANMHDIYETTTQEGAGGGMGRLGNIDIMRLPNRVMFWAY